MVLVIMDHFSKWTEIVPLRKVTTEALQKVIRERIVARHGVTKIMVTDNVQFTSRSFKKFLGELDVCHKFIAPTHAAGKSNIESEQYSQDDDRSAEKDQRMWDEHWPELMLAVNSTVSGRESTGYSPFFIMQGRKPRMPRALFDENALGTGRNAHRERDEAGITTYGGGSGAQRRSKMPNDTEATMMVSSDESDQEERSGGAGGGD
ncbi:uncharacterized protein [Drosophila bipectinata]|uniref:uncharacterized protein n=1 Tax=Drosophila bipectinata TaxID=42026 RepID=UPI0038B3ED45